ncbi:Beta-ketoadipate enol-lactone hydrolase [Actinomycetales bacterium JB111]|nr:Beta-ketoadipate enol-lactone hydrolase [Actinomycetales bacterium JB111]
MTTARLAHAIDGPADAPVVLMGSSLGADRRMWEHAASVLARRFRVVRYEHRGHGQSPTPEVPGPVTMDALGEDVVDLLDSLGVERAHVVGLSIGGMLANWLAQKHPERVDRVVIVCSAAHMPPAENWIGRAATVREQGLEAIVDPVLANWFTPSFDDAATRADMRERFLACDPEGYAQCCEAISTMDLRDGLGTIVAPTLVIAGRDDPSTPPEKSREIVDGIVAGGGSARLEVVGPAAHISAVEQPGAVTGLIVEFLDAARQEVAIGQRVRREVLGDDHVDAARTRQSAFDTPFQDLITRYAWGAVWGRDELDRRTRSAVTLALLAALGHEAELGMHVRAAIRNGLTVEEIGEVLTHTGVYAGVPVSNQALKIARAVLTEDGLLG